MKKELVRVGDVLEGMRCDGTGRDDKVGSKRTAQDMKKWESEGEYEVRERG